MTAPRSPGMIFRFRVGPTRASVPGTKFQVLPSASRVALPSTSTQASSWPSFAVDALECPDCGSLMRILTVIHPPESAKAILDCLGLPSRPPPLDPPRFIPEDPDQAPADW
jgi:hypothetical protein